MLWDILQKQTYFFCRVHIGKASNLSAPNPVLQNPLDSRSRPSKLMKQATMHTEVVLTVELIHPWRIYSLLCTRNYYRVWDQNGACIIALEPPWLICLMGCFHQERGWSMPKSRRKSQTSQYCELSKALGNPWWPDSGYKKSLGELLKVKWEDQGHLLSSREFFLHRCQEGFPSTHCPCRKTMMSQVWWVPPVIPGVRSELLGHLTLQVVLWPLNGSCHHACI